MRQKWELFFLAMMVLAVAGALVGCSTPAQKQAQQTQQLSQAEAAAKVRSNLGVRVAEGYSVVANMRLTAASLLKNKKISVDVARRVQTYCDEARKILDAAEQAMLKDPAGNEQTVTTLLLNVSNILAQATDQVMNATQGGK